MKKTIVALSVLAATGAQAQWAVYDARLEQGIKAVVEAVRGSAQSTVAAGSTTAEASSKALSQAMTNAEIDKQVDRFKSIGACDAIALSLAADAKRTTAPVGGRGATSGRGGSAGMGANHPLIQALRTSEGTLPPSSPEAQASTAAAGICKTFTPAGTLRAEACKAAGYSPEDTFGFGAADISASTLLDGPQKADKPFRRRLTWSTDSTDPADIAVRAFRRNLGIPIELRALRAGELNSTAGRQFMAFKDSYEARMSLADSAIRALTMNRAENPQLIVALDALTKSPVSGSFVTSYLEANAPKWKARGVSLDELTTIEVDRRHSNPAWHTNLVQTPGEPVAKEHLALAAHQSALIWRNIQAAEHGNLLLGQIASTLTRMESTAQLNQMHAAAVR